MAFGVSDTGLEMPREADYLTLIRDEFERLLTARGQELPDWDKDTVLGVITAALAARLDVLSEDVIQIDAGYHPANATGLQLENICAMIGVVRREATKSTVTMDLTADAGTTIPEGSVIEDDEKQRWETTEPLVFASTTTQQVVAEAQTPGAVAAPANTITKIVTPVDGWTSANNPAKATEGDDRESDAELRKRRILSLQQGTSGTVGGIRAAVFELDWTTAVVTVDNPTNATATVEGISMPPHSVATVVYPNSPTSDQIDDLVDALVDTVPAGIEQVGAVTQSHTFDDGHSATYAWDYATETTVDVTVTATALSGFTTGEVQSGIEDTITDYFLALGVGDDVTAIAISALVAAVDGVDTADVTVGAGAQKVTINATELATEGTISVTVT